MESDAAVTAAEIARLAGVGRAAVSNWRKRHDDFPKPVGGTTTSPTFSLAEVEHWLREQRKTGRLSPHQRLWQNIRGATEDIELTSAIGDIALLLLWMHRAPAMWPTITDTEGVGFTVGLPREVAAACGDIPGGRMTESELSEERAELLGAVGRHAAEHGARETYEFLFTEFLEANSRRMFTTPEPVASLMAHLTLAGEDGVVLDPACGSGSLLLAAADQGSRRVVGQELDEDLARLAAVRLAMNTSDSEVHDGHSLRRDAFEGWQADVALCNPTFGQTDWGYDELTYDPRWEYGLPPRSESELAWVQHALWHVRPGGMVAILMPPAAASRRSGRRIRQELLRRGALRAVVTLPAGEVPGTALGLHLWLLRRPAPGAAPSSDLLLVDTTGQDMDEATEQILDAWAAFSIGSSELSDRAGAIRIIDLLDDLVDCTPGRHLAAALDAEAAGRFTDTHQRLTALAARLPDLLERLTADQADGPALPTISIGELARSRAVRIVHGPGRAPAEPLHIEPGDVVIPLTGPHFQAQVAARNTTTLPDQPVAVLRPDPQALDPDFLAGFLSGPALERHAATSRSGTLRVDLRAVPVPRLPLAEQQRYGAVLRAMSELDRMITDARELGRELTGHLVTGFSSATLRPGSGKHMTSG
jgi:predicted DNA-binding transcriptional regulator AlpA